MRTLQTAVTSRSSSTASAISITRLLEHFNESNVRKFKASLMRELECVDEAQLLCKLIQASHQRMTPESLDILKHEAIQLAEQQPSPKNAKISLHTQIRRCTDCLSNLNSDMIDYFGTFLDKKQSIELGYLNRQLYIETQKQVYLLKRYTCNDPPLIINDLTAQRFCYHQTNPFAYSVPRDINIQFSNTNACTQQHGQKLHKSEQHSWYNWYQNVFYVLNNFRCNYFTKHHLNSIPISIFFDKKNQFQHIGRSKHIQTFTCSFSPCVWEEGAVKTFCDKFNQYYQNHCQDKFENIRNINEFIISRYCEKNTAADHDIKQLLFTFGKVSNKIKFTKCKLRFDDAAHHHKNLRNVFHHNLEVFEYDSETILQLNKYYRYENFALDCDVQNFELSLVVNEYASGSYNRCVLLMCEKLGLVSRIHCFKITLHSSHQSKRTLTPMLRDIFIVSRRNSAIASRDDAGIKNVSWNQTLMIKISRSTKNLYTFAEILEYLTEDRFEILHVKNSIGTISFEFDFADVCAQNNQIVAGDWGASSQMWLEVSDTEYPVSQNSIESKENSLTMKELGVLYHNMIKWFQNIQTQRGNDQLKQSKFLHIKLNKM